MVTQTLMYRYFFSLILCIVLPLYAVSLKQLEQECQKKSAKSCYHLGHYYDQKNNITQAAKHYQQACTFKHALGCYTLAELYLVGSGVKQSDDAFSKYIQKSCQLGYQKSCTFIQKNTPTKPSTLPHAASKNQKKHITIQAKHIGHIKVTAKLIDPQKRIVEISASMHNDFMPASGWLSFSFPEMRDNQATIRESKSFDHTKAYPQGSSIYHIKQKRAIPSRYLLVESDAKKWKKGVTKKSRFTLRVPEDIATLTLYVRGTLKHKTQLKSMPLKGTIGQQGFHNAVLKLTMGLGKKKQADIHMRLRPTRTSLHASRPAAIHTRLTRRDKLMLLDQLLDLSYYHRERKTFEKQLKETLFGGATYLTYIKSYQCEPKRSTHKSKCTLRLGGKTAQNNREVSWEFQAEFTARKDQDGLKITEMHTLDLWE